MWLYLHKIAKEVQDATGGIYGGRRKLKDDEDRARTRKTLKEEGADLSSIDRLYNFELCQHEYRRKREMQPLDSVKTTAHQFVQGA